MKKLRFQQVEKHLVKWKEAWQRAAKRHFTEYKLRRSEIYLQISLCISVLLL